MSEQDKAGVNQVGGQDIQQLQLTLKQTMKENKSLQSKINKLQIKYVQLFKEQKLLKQDRQNLISFILKWSIDSQGKTLYQEPILGQCNLPQLQAIAQQKSSLTKVRIQQLESMVQKNDEIYRKEAEKAMKEGIQKLNQQWQNRLKGLKQQQIKDNHSSQRQIESLKKSNQIKISELSQIKALLQNRTQELSKVSKQKLKIEHHLNNIRKKEISQQISPPEQQNQSKTLVDKNQYLSLKQQVQNLMSKRDELKRQLKKKEEESTNEHRKVQSLEKEVARLSNFQRQYNQKYQLVRQCSLEDLQNMILNFHSNGDISAPLTSKVSKGFSDSNENVSGLMMETKEQEIQKQYLKNMVIRYIKAQTSQNFEQAFTLLQIIGRLVKIDFQSRQALEQYKSKRKPWWYIKL